MSVQEEHVVKNGQVIQREPQKAAGPPSHAPRRPSLGLIIAAITGVVALLAALLVFVADDGGKEPVVQQAAFGATTTFLPADSAWSLGDAVAAPDGAIYVASKGATNAITRISPSGQVTSLKVPGRDVGGVVVAPDGTIWTSTVVDNASAIVSMAPDGSNVRLYQIPSVDLGPGGKRTEFPVLAMALAPNGNLWFQRGQINRWDSANGYTSAIGRVSLTGKMDVWPIADRLYAPGGMVVAPDGKVWFSAACVCARNGFIEVLPAEPTLDPATGKAALAGKYTVQTKASGAEGVGPHPSRLTVVGNDLWFVEQQDDFATEMNPAADISGKGAVARIPMDKPSNEAIVEYPLPARHSRPTGITLGGDGNLWITESGTGKVARMSTSGLLIGEYDVPGAPDDIVTGPDGNVYLTTGGAVDWTISAHTDGLTGNQFPSFNPQPNQILKFQTR